MKYKYKVWIKFEKLWTSKIQYDYLRAHLKSLEVVCFYVFIFCPIMLFGPKCRVGRGLDLTRVVLCKRKGKRTEGLCKRGTINDWSRTFQQEIRLRTFWAIADRYGKKCCLSGAHSLLSSKSLWFVEEKWVWFLM